MNPLDSALALYDAGHHLGHPERRQLFGRGFNASRFFSAVFVTMVRLGERTGKLEKNLEQLADWLERDEKLRRRVSGLAKPGSRARFFQGLLHFPSIGPMLK